MTVSTGSNETVKGANAINPIRPVVLPVDEILIVARVLRECRLKLCDLSSEKTNNHI